MKYKCNKCGKVLKSDSRKAWIKSWCEESESYARLMKVKRNLKIFSHWLAELREHALGRVYIQEEYNHDGTPVMMGKSEIRQAFNSDNMRQYFDEGLEPDDAFIEETANWD